MLLTRKHLVELGLTTEDRMVYEVYPIKVLTEDHEGEAGQKVTRFTWFAAGRFVDPSPQTLEDACKLLNKSHPLLRNDDAEVLPPESPISNELDPGLALDAMDSGS